MKKQILSGSLLIAGTTVGAGMLGLPLVTARAGLIPGMAITIFAWALMLATGLLFLEATLWMPLGSNLLSMSKRFLGEKGRWFSGAMFLFLYYCLLVAYFAAGAPLLMGAINQLFGLSISGFYSYFCFGAIFAFIVGFSAKWIDRTNLILITGMVLTYLLVIGLGYPQVESERFAYTDWNASLFAMPVLFSAFGFHNIIPSLCTYFGKKEKALKISVILGTVIALVIYLIWQWLVIGIIPKDEIAGALAKGLPVTAALQKEVGSVWIYRLGQSFAFFAIVTSLLGVSFSMIDFLADGLKVERKGKMRAFLSLITFFPPFIFVIYHPAVFDQALGIAGGVGEAILNGLIPISLVWVGRYHKSLKTSYPIIKGNRLFLAALGLVIVMVMIVEVYNLLSA